MTADASESCWENVSVAALTPRAASTDPFPKVTWAWLVSCSVRWSEVVKLVFDQPSPLGARQSGTHATAVEVELALLQLSSWTVVDELFVAWTTKEVRYEYVEVDQ